MPAAPELLVILFVALIVLGPKKLPEVARQVGRVMGELRRMNASFQAELRDALKEPVDGTPARGPTAAGGDTAGRTTRPPLASAPDAAAEAARHAEPPAGNGRGGRDGQGSSPS